VPILTRDYSLDAKGLPVRFRTDSQTGPAVPEPVLALQRIQQQLADHQKVWAEQLARDPAVFSQLESQIHQAFGQLADQLVASLLAQAAGQPALADAAKKK
jgi:hypothetical protein